MKPGITLVGDAVENPANALTLLHAAAMFGADCRFRDTKGLAHSEDFRGRILPAIEGSQVQALHERIVACDNLPGAVDVYGYDSGRDFALLVGNERRGLSHQLTALATDRVQVPMHSRRINCLNVGAAAAVALYYLCGPRIGPMQTRKHPDGRRPDLLLLEPSDHFELGSTLRSAAGFGWARVLVEDRLKVWFGCDRATRAEGRAAARRGRNEILLVPCPDRTTYAYPSVTVITRQPMGVPLSRSNLTGGPNQLVVIPDEAREEAAAADWARFGNRVEFACVSVPAIEFTYQYRLIASIALAEIARQVGRRPVKAPALPRPPIYDFGLGQLAEATGEHISFERLMEF